MDNTHFLLEVYELIVKEGIYEKLNKREEGFVNNIVSLIYKQLINDGLICNDFMEYNTIADTLLIDYGYEFSDEDILEELVKDLKVKAILDGALILENSSVVNSEETEKVVTLLGEAPYTVKKVTVYMGIQPKKEHDYSYYFKTAKELLFFLNSELLITQAEKPNKPVERCLLQRMEEFREELQALGIFGSHISEQLKEEKEAVGILPVLIWDEDRTVIKSAEFYLIQKITEYISK